MTRTIIPRLSSTGTEVRTLRRDVARMLTVVRERELQQEKK